MSASPRVVLSAIFLLISISLLAFVMPQHIEEMPQSHRRYLDSGGLGAAIWGVLCFVCGLHALAMTHRDESQVVADWNDKLRGTSEKEIRKVVGDYGDHFSCSQALNPFGRVGSFLLLLLRVVGNASFIFYNFHSLPKRNPEERLNQAKHCVTWMELPCMLFFLCFIVLLGVVMLCTRSVSFGIGNWLSVVKGASTFSVLLSLPLANPLVAKKRSQKSSGPKALLSALCRL